MKDDIFVPDSELQPNLLERFLKFTFQTKIVFLKFRVLSFEKGHRDKDTNLEDSKGTPSGILWDHRRGIKFSNATVSFLVHLK